MIQEEIDTDGIVGMLCPLRPSLSSNVTLSVLHLPIVNGTVSEEVDSATQSNGDTVESSNAVLLIATASALALLATSYIIYKRYHITDPSTKFEGP